MSGWMQWLAGGEEGFFAVPVFLICLAVVPAIVLLMLGMTRRHMARLRARFSGRTLARVLPRSVRWRRVLRNGLWLITLAGVLVALAEPRYDKSVRLIEQKGVDMVVAMDLSLSMDARDVDPSRLERARREIFDLIDMLEGDRVGLVIFGGGAYPRMPLTRDTNALRMVVEEASTRDFKIQGSALGEAIRVSIQLLTSDETSTAGRAVLVFSDGEVHDPRDALNAGTEARDNDVQIYGLGIGDKPSPIPTENGTDLRGDDGQVIMSRPTSDVLIELARMTGGAYVDSDPSDSDMRKLYKDGVRKRLEAGLTGSRQDVQWRSGFQWPLGLALLAGLLAAWMGDGRRPFGAALVALLAVGVLAPGEAWAGARADADQAYRDGDYSEAVRGFSELVLDNPGDPDLFERLGAARYRQGDYDGAARAWEEQVRLQGRGDPDALFNTGNAHYQSGRLEDAMERYDDVLASNPSHQGAAQNRELVQREIEARRQHQPPGDQDSNSSNDSGQSDPSDPNNQTQPNGQPPGDSDPNNSQSPNSNSEDPQSDSEDASQQGGGKSDGERTDSDKSGSGENPTENGGGQKPVGDEQVRDGSDTTETADMDQVDSDEGPHAGGTGTAGQVDGEPSDEGGMTAAQAERLLERVEEGRPRVVLPGKAGDKPW